MKRAQGDMTEPRTKSFLMRRGTALLLAAGLVFAAMPALAQAAEPTAVQTAFVAPRLDTSARLNGRVNPEGQPVTYHFEYSEDDGSTWTALPDRENTSEAGRQIVVGEELSGLDPGATYSYRFMAENTNGPAAPQGVVKTFTTRTVAEVQGPQSCPNEEVRLYQHGSYFGDCRAAELVNNPDKGNQNVQARGDGMFAPPVTVDGEKALWSVNGGAPGAPTGTQSPFLAERTFGGWRSHAVVPPASQQVGGGELTYHLEATTPDFSSFVFTAQDVGLLNVPFGGRFVRINSDGSQDVLATLPNRYLGVGSTGLVEVTEDGSHVFFLNRETLQLEDIGAGTPEAFSILPDGSPTACGVGFDLATSFAGITNNPGTAGVNWQSGYHRFALTSGSPIYFQAPLDGGCQEQGALLERNLETGTTTVVDAGTSSSMPEVIRATADGGQVYFTTGTQLDPVDVNSGRDVYRWDAETEEASCLTCVVSDAEVLGPVLVSDDSSHIYFKSLQPLIPGEGHTGDENIYVLDGGEVNFVADLGAPTGQADPFTAIRSATELSADGNVLSFTAPPFAGLTSDAISAECRGVQARIDCAQLYRYDDRDRSVECVSCLRGAPTKGAVETGSTEPHPAFDLSADGSTLAFLTNSKLLPRDVNGGQDVYEWRNGVVHLVTDGLTEFAESFSGAMAVRGVSADGRDIFYKVTDPGRTGFESDGLANLYDARIDGGFMPPAPSAHCSEESCQGPLQGAPPLQSPASKEISGAGDQAGNKKRSGKRSRCGKRGTKAKSRRGCPRRHHHHSARNTNSVKADKGGNA